jgi:hypothetical protein
MFADQLEDKRVYSMGQFKVLDFSIKLGSELAELYSI